MWKSHGYIRGNPSNIILAGAKFLYQNHHKSLIINYYDFYGEVRIRGFGRLRPFHAASLTSHRKLPQMEICGEWVGCENHGKSRKVFVMLSIAS